MTMDVCGILGAVGAVSVVMLASVAQAQDRVETRWSFATSGDWEDGFRWSNGAPVGDDVLWDVVIDSIGSNYIVDLLMDDRDEPAINLQILRLDSTNATLQIRDQRRGAVSIHERLELLQGRLRLQKASLVGFGEDRVVANISDGFEIQSFIAGGGDSDRNFLKNFDFHGGDLRINATEDLDFSRSSVRDGALVFRSSGRGNLIMSEGVVDFDIRFENTSSDEQLGILGAAQDIRIAKGVEISGERLVFGSGIGEFGSYINEGTIRSLGGDSSFQYLTNAGLIDVGQGVHGFLGSNSGESRVREGGKLNVQVSGSGSTTFENSGVIDVSGLGSTFRVNGPSRISSLQQHDLFRHTGTIRAMDHALLQIGSMRLDEGGAFERDETSRIEIIGRVNLGGGLMDRNTFGGEAVLTTGFPGTSGNDGGQIYNGQMDLSGGWFRYGHTSASLSHVELIGGPIFLDSSYYDDGPATLIFDNVSLRDGNLFLGAGTTIRFQSFYGGEHRFESSILTTGGTANIELQGNITFGPDTVLRGNLNLGISSYLTNTVINEGTVLVGASYGRINFRSNFTNQGTTLIDGRDTSSSRVFRNEGELTIRDAVLTGQDLENVSFMELLGDSSVILNDSFTLGDGSDLRVEMQSGTTTFLVRRDIVLGGSMMIDLSRISFEGEYALYTSQQGTISGSFDSVEFFGLKDGLLFGGFDQSTGIITIVPTPGSLAILGLGLIGGAHRRR